MATSTAVTLALREERAKQAKRDLQEASVEQAKTIRALKRDLEDEQIIAEVQQKTGGLVTTLIGIVMVGVGFGLGTILQRWIEGTEWENTSKAPGSIAVVTMVAVPLSVASLFVTKTRVTRTVVASLLMGVAGGGYIGHELGEFEDDEEKK